MKVFQQQFPGLDAYNQPYLLNRFVAGEDNYEDHEALGDCINLKTTIEKAAKEKVMTVEKFLERQENPSIWSF